MVKHDLLIHGVRLDGTEHAGPVILQMHDDDFPARFLQDLAAGGKKPISSAKVFNPREGPLFQPVQRMMNVALVKLSCQTPTFPRLDPRRIESAGLVIRRVFRPLSVPSEKVRKDQPSPEATDSARKHPPLSAWVRFSNGQFRWVRLQSDEEDQDPEPGKRPMLQSGQAELDRRLAALVQMTAKAESFTPAFVAPPDTCSALGRTVVYALIPTASSEVSDARPPKEPLNYGPSGLADSLPTLLKSGQHTPAPAAGQQVDYRWLSEDFLQTQSTDVANQFRVFSTALRMLRSVFGAFDGSAKGQGILQLLNKHQVYNLAIYDPSQNLTGDPIPSMVMGDFYQAASIALLNYNAYPDPVNPAPPVPIVTLPTAWDPFTDQDQNELLTALSGALSPRALKTLMPQGRFQDPTREYRLRLFFRIKGETPRCPARLVWSEYSEPFRIAAWHESSDRPNPPVPLPDPDKSFVQNAKPNCSFVVPKRLMGALQGTSMSGLMSGSGGGSPLQLDWICGFNIPLITICAFFVLNIFLTLLNIVFFWLPFIKICIPFPMPSSSTGDDD